MTLVAVAHHLRPEALLSAAAPYLEAGDEVSAKSTEWGSIVVAGAPVARSGRWQVIGVPQSSPWGVPGTDLPGEEVAAELERYGPAALQLTSGPFVAIDESDGAVLRALNGIFPLIVSSGDPWLTSSSPQLVRAATGTTGRVIAPGELLSPDATRNLQFGEIVAEDVPNIAWHGIEAEIMEHLRPVGGMVRARLGVGPGLDDGGWSRYVLAGRRRDRPLFVPPLASRYASGGLARYLRLRDEVLPILWRLTRLVGGWLCAPTFERPVLELVSYAAARNASGPP